MKLIFVRVRPYGTVKFLGKIRNPIIQQPIDKLFEDKFQAKVRDRFEISLLILKEFKPVMPGGNKRLYVLKPAAFSEENNWTSFIEKYSDQLRKSQKFL